MWCIHTAWKLILLNEDCCLSSFKVDGTVSRSFFFIKPYTKPMVIFQALWTCNTSQLSQETSANHLSDQWPVEIWGAGNLIIYCSVYNKTTKINCLFMINLQYMEFQSSCFTVLFEKWKLDGILEQILASLASTVQLCLLLVCVIFS